MKIALVHDYLFGYGGAERVLESLHEIWPSAPVYTSFVDWDWVRNNKKDWLEWKIIPSWFDKVPFKKSLCSPFRFLAPWIWESFDLRDFDVVISSSAWFMPKGVITHPGTVHVCYCHTPPRYLYGYPESGGEKSFPAKLYASIVNPGMRHYDFITSQRVDHFLCNSENVKNRIKKFYRRDADVIYPPINSIKQLNNETIKQTKNSYYLMVNRLVWPKRVDLAIKVCKKLKLNLKICGEGKLESELKELAGDSPNIQFLGYVDEVSLNKLYNDCKAVLYLAQEEDFGMTPIEAMSWGKPVIALKSGGVVESVIANKTGLFIEKANADSLEKVISEFERNPGKIKPKDCIIQAEKFSQVRFQQEIKKFINKLTKNEN